MITILAYLLTTGLICYGLTKLFERHDPDLLDDYGIVLVLIISIFWPLMIPVLAMAAGLMLLVRAVDSRVAQAKEEDADKSREGAK